MCITTWGHTELNREGKPLSVSSRHLNLSGKHSAADLNGMERKYDLGTE